MTTATIKNIVTGEETQIEVDETLVEKYGRREAEDIAIEQYLESNCN